MVEVPSHLAKEKLVFIDEAHIARGRERASLLEGPSVFIDAGTGVDAELMGWFLRAEGGPLTPDMRDRLDSLNDAEGSCDDGAEEFDCVDYLSADDTCDDGVGGEAQGMAGQTRR